MEGHASRALQFLLLAGGLKRAPRSGWIRAGVSPCESVADHAYRMALAAMVGARVEGLDVGRAVQIALVHDLAEAIVGDINPHDNVPKDVKRRLEADAMDLLCRALQGGSAEVAALAPPSITTDDGRPRRRNRRSSVAAPGSTLVAVSSTTPEVPAAEVLALSEAASAIRELWQEYESGSTPEARLVKDIDRVEMCVQAFEYEAESQLRHPESLRDSDMAVGTQRALSGSESARSQLDAFFAGVAGSLRTGFAQRTMAALERVRGSRLPSGEDVPTPIGRLPSLVFRSSSSSNSVSPSIPGSTSSPVVVDVRCELVSIAMLLVLLVAVVCALLAVQLGLLPKSM